MKAVVFYYSQSGQALDAAKSICSSLSDVVYKQIVPQQEYPFPWDKYDFFGQFPETRLLLPPSGIKPIELSDVEDADIVMIVGQSWYLSPSLPIQSFMQDETTRQYLNGRNVVFVNVCRNMWLMTSRWLKQEMRKINANLIGQIILQDEHQNLVSALTIVRWLMYGKKAPSLGLPAAGIAEKDIKDATRFGQIIANNFENGKTAELQDDLLSAGAIHYKPSVLFLEKVGYRMFGLWAPFIRRRGEYGDKRRKTRLNMFFYYLLFVLFILSPFAQIVFWLTAPFRRIAHHRAIDTSVDR